MPVVCTDCPIGGAAAVITHKENGMLTKVGDHEDFAKAITEVLGSPELSARLSANAAKIREELSLENIATNEVGEGRLGIKIGEKALSCDLSQIKRSLDGALARASELLTLKMGDIIFISATEAEKVAIGESIAVSLNENCLLDFAIK